MAVEIYKNNNKNNNYILATAVKRAQLTIS